MNLLEIIGWTSAADKIHGNINKLKKKRYHEITDWFLIEGWAVSPQGIECVDIYIDSVLIGQAHYGILRQDIFDAYPNMPNAGKSGFCFAINKEHITPITSHTIKIVAKSMSGNTKTWTRVLKSKNSIQYQQWLIENEKIYSNKKASTAVAATEFSNTLSLLFIIELTIDHQHLMQTLKSLAAQQANFELIFITDSTNYPMIIDALKTVQLTNQSHLTTNSSNDWASIVSLCSGHFIGFMDIGDVLRPWALHVISDTIQAHQTIELIYADEDSFVEGQHCEPIFKPGWSPVFLNHYNYIGKPWFATKNVMLAALINPNTQKLSIDEHVLLKIIGNISASVCHIPTVLIARKDSSNVRPAITENQPDISPTVSIIIPTQLANIKHVERCFSALINFTNYPNLEIIIVVNNLKDEALAETFLKQWPFNIIFFQGPFNWSTLNNFGVRHSTGDYLLFMNDDIEPLHDNWLALMMNTLINTNAGVVGALLKYPNGSIQHAGINFYKDRFSHLFRYCSDDDQHLQWLLHSPREVSAVTGACLLTTRTCFQSHDGFDDDLAIIYNDTDFCLRVLQNGFSIIIQPKAQLIHHEGISRQGLNEKPDSTLFWTKWKNHLEKGDQFTNPNLNNTQNNWAIGENGTKPYKERVYTDFKREHLKSC